MPASINPQRLRERSGWNVSLVCQSSSKNEQSVGRWSGPLPMASGLVKRAVERGDIFLVIENTVYVANVSWSGIWQEVLFDCLARAPCNVSACDEHLLAAKLVVESAPIISVVNLCP